MIAVSDHYPQGVERSFEKAIEIKSLEVGLRYFRLKMDQRIDTWYIYIYAYIYIHKYIGLFL